MASKKFWVVWRQDGARPTVRHNSRSSAVAEATRLAREYPGGEFVVFEAIGSAKTTNVLWTAADEEESPAERNGLPF